MPPFRSSSAPLEILSARVVLPLTRLIPLVNVTPLPLILPPLTLLLLPQGLLVIMEVPPVMMPPSAPPLVLISMVLPFSAFLPVSAAPSLPMVSPMPTAKLVMSMDVLLVMMDTL